MSDIDLYTIHPDHYDQLQHLRPDYVGAQQTFVDFAVKYLNSKQDVSIVDFCSGVGKDTCLVCDRVSVKNARLIDINGDFLKIAQEKGIKAENVSVEQSDILKANVGYGNDAVLSMFAYHHVHDGDKAAYIVKVKDSLKPGGILLLGEIYSPDKETTLRYYDHLIRSIPTADANSELKSFLEQTARSENFEFKVSRQFAHDQLTAAGFELLEFKKIWPIDNVFSADVGTFVEVWRMDKMLKIINKYTVPTKEATDLKKALEQKGVRVYVELNDGYKHIDLAIPDAKLNIEVDGIRHLTDPHQIVADLARGYYSHKNGYDTMHIPNEMVHNHLEKISDALAEASKIRERKIRIHMD